MQSLMFFETLVKRYSTKIWEALAGSYPSWRISISQDSWWQWMPSDSYAVSATSTLVCSSLGSCQITSTAAGESCCVSMLGAIGTLSWNLQFGRWSIPVYHIAQYKLCAHTHNYIILYIYNYIHIDCTIRSHAVHSVALHCATLYIHITTLQHITLKLHTLQCFNHL